jgi:YesN/AraC family two-component response regulator
LINQNLHKDFNTFINEYRIDEAIGMLEDDSGLALGNVAYEVGFNNNVTFYKAFKKYKGTSPSEYLREFILNSTG